MFAMRNYRRFGFVVVMVILTASIVSAQKQRQVDDAALKTGSKTGDEWIAYGVNWAEQRYSPLKQIDTSNVSRLSVAWSTEIPVAAGNTPQTH